MTGRRGRAVYEDLNGPASYSVDLSLEALLIMGVVLGPLELGFRSVFYSHPISLAIFIATVIVLVLPAAEGWRLEPPPHKHDTRHA